LSLLNWMFSSWSKNPNQTAMIYLSIRSRTATVWLWNIGFGSGKWLENTVQPVKPDFQTNDSNDLVLFSQSKTLIDWINVWFKNELFQWVSRESKNLRRNHCRPIPNWMTLTSQFFFQNIVLTLLLELYLLSTFVPIEEKYNC